jgi:putative membrane protein
VYVEKEKHTVDSKYIQQHLANERTYLAWVRTAIAIIGIGFVIVNLHFTLQDKLSHAADLIAVTVGALAFLLGTLTIVFASNEYMRKRRQINSQTFRAAYHLILIISSALVVCLFVMGILFMIYAMHNLK